MGHGSRKPTSNDPPRRKTNETKWVDEALTDFKDVTVLLLGEDAKRCSQCERPALLVYLKDNKCPDCRKVDMKPNLYRSPVRQWNVGRASAGDGEAD